MCLATGPSFTLTRKHCPLGPKNTLIWSICKVNLWLLWKDPQVFSPYSLLTLLRYIEGAFDSSLLELPPDMLDEMSSLTFIHLEMHLRLQTLPSCTDM
ncbi:hypothetical protein GQ600_18861 [Phytophthora cactorum]|nr:hypothetical protein GQ600_18861 [Phytophthora cactorum]